LEVILHLFRACMFFTVSPMRDENRNVGKGVVRSIFLFQSTILHRFRMQTMN